MKSFLLFIALLCALTLGTSLTSPVTSAASAAKNQRGVVKFDEPVTVMGVTLKGEYLFVHDDEAMARGEACTYIYKGLVDFPDKLAVSFHCTPAVRAKAAKFTVRTQLTPAGQPQLKEFQFAGSTEGHKVPVNPHACHVTIAS